MRSTQQHVGVGGLSHAPKLSSVSSTSDLGSLRDPSPLRPFQAVSHSQSTGALLPPSRSKSVPVQARQAAPAPSAVSAMGIAPTVSLARWAASPAPGQKAAHGIANSMFPAPPLP